VLLPYLLGLFLILAGTIKDFHQLLSRLLGIGYDFLVADVEVRQFTAKANHPLPGLGKLCLHCEAFPCLSFTVEEL
jgi:hypothetical protein